MSSSRTRRTARAKCPTRWCRRFSVKEAVFPFNKFPGVDPILSPEMRSTGEVMGAAKTFGEAMLKSQIGAGSRLPRLGQCADHRQEQRQGPRRRGRPDLHARLWHRGHQGHGGGHRGCRPAGTPDQQGQDGWPHAVDLLKGGEIQLVFTTVDETRTAIADSRHIRQAALANRVTYYTTMAGCEAAVEGMKHQDGLLVQSLQELHAELT